MIPQDMPSEKPSVTPQDILTKGYVFPLTSERKPLIKWRTGSAKGISSFPSHKGPWGLDCGKSHLVVIDVDHKNGKADGLANMWLLGDLPETYTVRTRSGGLHIYFHNPAGCPAVANSASKLAPHIDVRGEGGFVVVYDDVVCSAPIAKLPDDLRLAMGTVIPKDDIPTDSLIVLDQPKNIHAAIEYLRQAEIAVEGDAGDLTTLRVAMHLKDLGLSPEAALEAMLSDWNERCEPPWGIGELERKIRNAYEYGRNAPGSATREHTLTASALTAEEVFAAVKAHEVEEPEEVPNKSSEPTTFTLNDLDNIPPREWLIDKLIPKGCIYAIYGEGGTGKSMAAVEMGVCVSNGVPFYGHKVPEPCPVLYVSCEDDLNEVKRRTKAVIQKESHNASDNYLTGFNVWDRTGEDSVLVISTNNGLIKRKFLKEFESKVAGIAGDGCSRLVIIDTVIDAAEICENDRSVVNAFVKAILGGIAKKYNATIVYLAHPSKSSTVSGSTAWVGSVRGVAHIKRHETERDLRWLVRAKGNYSGIDWEGDGTLLKWERGAFVEIDPDKFEGEMIANQSMAVWRHILAHEGIKCAPNSSRPIKKEEILDEHGLRIPPERVDKIVKEMLEDGRLRLGVNKELIAENFEEED